MEWHPGALLFSFSLIFFGLGARFLLTGVPELLEGIRTGRERKTLLAATHLLRELEELLGAGLIPDREKWDAVKTLGPPWGRLASESLSELRASGGELLPTLKRLRELAEAHSVSMTEARARASQALAQAGFCAIAGPLFGATLYWIFPGVAGNPWGWGLACLLVFAISSGGALWMIQLAETARWGGLTGEARSWPLVAQCGGERFLSLIRSGEPPDLAWSRAHELIRAEAPVLAAEWGASVWQSPADEGSALSRKPAQRVLVEAGESIRKSVQVSLMEGRPCVDRVEAVLRSLRSDFGAQVDRELGLLGTRVLKPLFICVAPGILGLLGFAMWLGFQEALGL